jgi:hypothetical protein
MKNLNLYTSRAKSTLSNGSCRFVLIALAIILSFGTNVYAQTFVNIDQAANGKFTEGSVTGTVSWQNGNLGKSNSHFLETYSVPYRVRISGLTSDVVYTYIIGYDTRVGGKMALDFLTHFQRLTPHTQFGHGAEEIKPLDGLSPTYLAGITNFGSPSTYEIPLPNNNIPAVGGAQQPTSFAAGQPRNMTMYGGTIQVVGYDAEGSLTASSSETRVYVQFVANGPNAVISWGANIAGEAYWGQGMSAVSINGSPYHMRHKGYKVGTYSAYADGGYTSLGNTDRSLKTDAVYPTVSCLITGDTPVCGGTTNTYTATSDAPGATFVWSINTGGNGTIVATSQTTTATATGGTQSTIDVTAGASGSYILSVVISAPGYLNQTCPKTVTINPVPAAPNVTYLHPACDETTFGVRINNPLANATYTLRNKCGNTILDYTNGTITTGSTPGANITFTGIPAGTGYSVTVTKDGCTSAAAQCGDISDCPPPPPSGGRVIQSESSNSLKGVEPTKIDESVTAYPVPFRGKTTVEFKLAKSERYEINLYDMRGNLVKQLKSGKAKAGELQQVEVDGANLAEGMYLVRVVSSQGAKTVKLLKKE